MCARVRKHSWLQVATEATDVVFLEAGVTGGCELYPVWVLGTEVRVSARAVKALNRRAISPACFVF